VGGSAQVARSPHYTAAMSRIDCNSFAENCFEYLRMVIVNSGKIKHLKKIRSLGELYNSRIGYRGATCLRGLLT
jgi:hypothetical protein